MPQVRVLPQPWPVWWLASFHRLDGALGLVAAGREAVWALDPVTGAPTAMFDDLQWAPTDIAVCRRAGREPVLAVATELGLEWFDPVTGASCYGPTTDDTIWSLTTAPAIAGTDTLFGAGHRAPYPIHRWDASTGAMQPDLGEHDNHIVCVAALASPDGTQLVAATGWSGPIYLWDPATGDQHGPPLAGHESIVHAMDTVRLPDGRLLLASADSAGQIRRWDVGTGSPIGDPIQAHPEYASVIAMPTAGGAQLLTSGSDKVIRRWDAITGALLGDVGTGNNTIILTIDGIRMLAIGGSQHLTLQPLPD